MHKSTRPNLDTNANNSNGLSAVLAHHDAEIVNLSARMTGVEQSVNTLSDQQRNGFATMAAQFADLKSSLLRIDSAPKLDVHKIISSVVAIAILFSMIVGGIIWVTQSQFSGVVARQEAWNAAIMKTVERHDGVLQRRNEDRAMIGLTSKDR